MSVVEEPTVAEVVPDNRSERLKEILTWILVLGLVVALGWSLLKWMGAAGEASRYKTLAQLMALQSNKVDERTVIVALGVPEDKSRANPTKYNLNIGGKRLPVEVWYGPDAKVSGVSVDGQPVGHYFDQLERAK
jgi:hypothetical protein